MTVYCEQCGWGTSPAGAFCEQCGASFGLAATTSATPSDSATADRVRMRGALTPDSHERPVALRGIAMADGRSRSRSKAWVYYSILTLLSLVALFGGHAVGLAGIALFGTYATYLYRGGRFVVWFW